MCAAHFRDLTDAEYCLYLEYEESRVNHAQATLELLSAALLLFKDPRHERIRSELGFLMAAEHMATNNIISARKLLLQVAYTYRRYGLKGIMVLSLVTPSMCGAS